MYNFLKKFTEEMNSKNIISFYNEEAIPTTEIYAVISNPTESSLRFGTQIFFDIFIWANENTKYEKIIKVCDSLKSIIDNLHFNDLLATVYVETIKKVDDKDYKKIKAQISCVARIMSE